MVIYYNTKHEKERNKEIRTFTRGHIDIVGKGRLQEWLILCYLYRNRKVSLRAMRGEGRNENGEKMQ